MIVYIDSYQTFNVRYRMNMSSVQPGTHLVNLTLTKSIPKGLPDDQFEVPKIQAVEIINDNFSIALKD
jgi:hypothetical protein